MYDRGFVKLWNKMNYMNDGYTELLKQMDDIIDSKDGVVKEKIDGDYLTLHVPGFSIDDFDITVEGGVLSVKADCEEFGVIDRSYNLKDYVESINVTVVNGILTIECIGKKSHVEVNMM